MLCRWLTVVLLFVAGVASADYPEISARVQPTSATVGQRLDWTVVITAPELERLTIEQPKFDKQTTWALVSAASAVDENIGSNLRRRTLRYTIAPFEVGEVLTPAFNVGYQPPNTENTSPTLKEVPRVPVQVHTVLTAEVKDPRDIKGPVRPPLAPWWPWAVSALAAIALLFIAWKMWRRLHPGIRNLISPPKRLDEWAMDEINNLERERLIEQQKTRELYTRLSEVLRLFLGRVYQFNAIDCTTGELIGHLSGESLPPPDSRGKDAEAAVEELLDEADLVKFAKYQPDASTCRRALDRARDVVQRHWNFLEMRTNAAASDAQPVTVAPPVVPVDAHDAQRQDQA